jgi:succinate dehydrogenase flavin-adding protein (antitoxin of CptAB toxin-antitoxin module)
MHQKHLIYHLKQCGWLEVDLLLGTWVASGDVPKLEVDKLDQFEDFVNMETINIYDIITLQIDVLDALKCDGAGIVLECNQDWERLGKIESSRKDRPSQVPQGCEN